jgi:hypothetical protein
MTLVNDMKIGTTKLLLALFIFMLGSISATAQETKIKWHGHAAFSITTPDGKVLLILQTSYSEMTKVRRAIDAGNAVWVEAWAKGDATMLPDTFTADGAELVAGGKVFKGRKQILALMRETMQKRGGKAKLTVTTTDVWLDGNTAYENVQ